MLLMHVPCPESGNTTAGDSESQKMESDLNLQVKDLEILQSMIWSNEEGEWNQDHESMLNL